MARSGVHLTGADSGWPVASDAEPQPHKTGEGGADTLPKVTAFADDEFTAAREVQVVSVTGWVAGTQMTLTFDGQTTAALDPDRTAAQILAALEALSNIAPGDIAVTGPNGGPYAVDFLEAGAYGDTDVPEITGAGTGVDEVQTVSITGSPTGGSFRLKFAGKQTGNIAFDADAAAVDAALEALSTIGAGDVAVTGTNPNFTVTFGGALADEDVPQLQADHSTLTGGTSPAVAIATTTPGVAAPVVSTSEQSGGS